jgi:hypothetical protein
MTLAITHALGRTKKMMPAVLVTAIRSGVIRPKPTDDTMAPLKKHLQRVDVDVT